VTESKSNNVVSVYSTVVLHAKIAKIAPDRYVFRCTGERKICVTLLRGTRVSSEDYFRVQVFSATTKQQRIYHIVTRNSQRAAPDNSLVRSVYYVHVHTRRESVSIIGGIIKHVIVK
jgi:hypothetical protein